MNRMILNRKIDGMKYETSGKFKGRATDNLQLMLDFLRSLNNEPTQQVQIAEELGLSQPTVSVNLKELIRRGTIVRNRSRGSTSYTLKRVTLRKRNRDFTVKSAKALGKVDLVVFNYLQNASGYQNSVNASKLLGLHQTTVSRAMRRLLEDRYFTTSKSNRYGKIFTRTNKNVVLTSSSTLTGKAYATSTNGQYSKVVVKPMDLRTEPIVKSSRDETESKNRQAFGTMLESLVWEFAKSKRSNNLLEFLSWVENKK